MNILTVENKSYDLNNIPEVVDDIRFCVLDCSDPTNIDFFFFPLIFIESFNAPSMVLKIGNYTMQSPLQNPPFDWKVLVGDPGIGQLELMPIDQLNDRDFDVFVYNPLTGKMPDYKPASIINMYAEVKWFFPKIRHGCFLVVPIASGENPPCIFLTSESSKFPEVIDHADLIF